MTHLAGASPPPHPALQPGGAGGVPATPWGCLAVGTPAGTNPAGSALPGAWAPRPAFYCLYLPLLFPPRNLLIAPFSGKDLNCVKKRKRHPKSHPNPTVLLCLSPVKNQPQPQALYSGGAIIVHSLTSEAAFDYFFPTPPTCNQGRGKKKYL